MYALCCRPSFLAACKTIGFGFLTAFALWSQPPAPPPASPPQARIAIAEKRTTLNAKSWEAYNGLAFALCRLARDTAELELYEKADVALRRSLQLSPGNRDARKLSVTVLLGKHEFERARLLAVELNSKMPDDIAGWGLLVDVNVALGNYPEAERDAQWVLDLRPGSTLGFIKAAGLREIFGDPEGAAEFYDEAAKRTARSDLDEQAWLLTQSAREALLLGQPGHAEDLLNRALQLFPDSQLALTGLAAVRTNQGRFVQAAALLERKYRKAPSPGNLYDWAEALERSGQGAQAATAFHEFQLKANATAGNVYNWNRPLIYFYLDREPDPPRALQLAEREMATRHDWAAMEAYAWTLYRNGRRREAEKLMAQISAIGIRYPEHLCHAAQIGDRPNDAASSCPPRNVAQSALWTLP